MAYDDSNSFALFKNDKGGNDRRPDYRGKGKIGGRPVEISCWLKEKRDGSGKFLSCTSKFTDERPPERTQGDGFAPIQPRQASKPAKPSAELDEDVPF